MRSDAPRIGILVSGTGSNLQAIIEARDRGELSAELALVVSSAKHAPALARARAASIPARVLELHDRKERAARIRFEQRLLDTLLPFRLDLLVLAGWMLILSGDFLHRCRMPVLNIHPALLEPTGNSPVPVLRGAHCVRDALRMELPVTGATVHLVTDRVDDGPTLAMESIEIVSGDTEETLRRRIQAVEHRILPRAIQGYLDHTGQGAIT
ncbi:MAG: phosphoribosylglycinamide formyltransferase [Chloroflexota bacterium]